MGSVKKTKLIKFSKVRKKKTMKRNNKKSDGLNMRGGSLLPLLRIPTFSGFGFGNKKKLVTRTPEEQELVKQKIIQLRTAIAIAKVQGNSKAYKLTQKIKNKIKQTIDNKKYSEIKKNMAPYLAKKIKEEQARKAQQAQALKAQQAQQVQQKKTKH